MYTQYYMKSGRYATEFCHKEEAPILCPPLFSLSIQME
eukprot:UN17523